MAAKGDNTLRREENANGINSSRGNKTTKGDNISRGDITSRSVRDDWHHFRPERTKLDTLVSHSGRRQGFSTDTPVFVALPSLPSSSVEPLAVIRRTTLITGRQAPRQLPNLVTPTTSNSSSKLPTNISRNSKRPGVKTENSDYTKSPTEYVKPQNIDDFYNRVSKFKALILPKHQSELDRYRKLHEQYALKQRSVLNIRLKHIKPIKSHCVDMYSELEEVSEANEELTHAVQSGRDEEQIDQRVTDKNEAPEGTRIMFSDGEAKSETNIHNERLRNFTKSFEIIDYSEVPDSIQEVNEDEYEKYQPDLGLYNEDEQPKGRIIFDFYPATFGQRELPVWRTDAMVKYQQPGRAKRTSSLLSLQSDSSTSSRRGVMRRFNRLEVFSERKPERQSPHHTDSVVEDTKPPHYLPLTRQPTYKLDPVILRAKPTFF